MILKKSSLEQEYVLTKLSISFFILFNILPQFPAFSTIKVLASDQNLSSIIGILTK